MPPSTEGEKIKICGGAFIHQGVNCQIFVATMKCFANRKLSSRLNRLAGTDIYAKVIGFERTEDRIAMLPQEGQQAFSTAVEIMNFHADDRGPGPGVQKRRQ